MKTLLSLIAALLFLMVSTESVAQVRGKKGFDYQHHQKVNRKAAHWGERRLKAADYDQANVKCSVRTSRRYARSRRK